MTRADEDEILRGVYTECNECAQDDNRGSNKGDSTVMLSGSVSC